MTKTSNFYTQNDLKTYLLSCDIEDLTEDKIFFNWKQGQEAFLKQWKNKYNITIINDGKDLYGKGAKTKYFTEQDKDYIQKQYIGMTKYIIKVFNWYGSLGNGLEKDFFDCESIFLQVIDALINHEGLVSYHLLDYMGGFHPQFGGTYIEYGCEIILKHDFIITTEDKNDYIDNAHIKTTEIVKK